MYLNWAGSSSIPMNYSIFSVILLCSIGAHRTNQEQVCPCIQLADGSCFQYDSRYMAPDLEDALVSFPDLTLLNPPDPVDFRPRNGQRDKCCNSPECLICQEDIRQRVTEIGLANFTQLNESHAQFSNVTCRRYGFTLHEDKYDSPESKHHCMYYDSSSTSTDDSSNDTENESSLDIMRRKHKRSRLRKRSQPQTTASILGVRYGIACTRKGAASITSKEPVSLCSSCWAWRQLPANYFPRYINELICDDSDNACLSGYAVCSAGHRTLEVLRNDTGVFTTVLLTAGTYCECKVSPTSALFSLVNGTGISSSLPPV